MTSTVEIFHQRHCPLGNSNVLKPEKITVDRVYIYVGKAVSELDEFDSLFSISKTCGARATSARENRLYHGTRVITRS